MEAPNSRHLTDNDRLTPRDEFALALYYVRMLRTIAHEQVRQRKLIEAIYDLLEERS